MSLISNLIAYKNTERASQLAAYAEIMARADNPQEGDEAAVEALMFSLGLSIEDVASDALQFAKVADLQAVVDTEAVVVAQIPAVTASLVTADTVYKSAVTGRKIAADAVESLQSQVRSIESHKHEIAELKQQNPRLIGQDWK